jgi:hypothetical protein
MLTSVVSEQSLDAFFLLNRQLLTPAALALVIRITGPAGIDNA